MGEQEVPLKADVQDILPIIKRFMYSEREIFLRELISNSIDALEKFNRISLSSESGSLDVEPLRVEVTLDPVRSTVTIADNGIGMSRDDVVRYINQIAFSGAKEFLEQYPQGGSNLIGRFGLGFYSSFMVSDLVQIDTLSWATGAGGCHWRCDGSPQTRIGPNRRQNRGTAVVCHLLEDAHEFLDSERVEKIIRHYLDYAPFPILLAGRKVNVGAAPWHLSSDERAGLPRERYWSFYKQLHPDQNRPLAWFHVDCEYPVQARALLFVPDHGENSQGSVRLFADRTFVCDHSSELLPTWLDFLDGVVDSPDLPVNVARDKFQQDRRVSLLRNHLSLRTVSFLNDLFDRQRADYIRIWERFGSHLKTGYLDSVMSGQNSLSPKLERMLLFQSSRKPFTTIEEYLERCLPENKETVLYLTDPQAQQSHAELLRNRNREVLWLTGRFDPLLIRTLAAAHRDWSFVRVDQLGVVETAQTSTSAPDSATHATDWTNLTELFREIAGSRVTRVSVEPLPSLEIPAVLNVTEAAAVEDDLRRLVGKEADTDRHWHLALNTNSPLIQRLGALGSKVRSEEVAAAIVAQIWDNVRLSANLLTGEHFSAALQRSREFLLLVAKKNDDPT